MASGTDSCIARLNREWAQLQHRAAPSDWIEGPATLADALAGIGLDPDVRLGDLLARHQAGESLAGRVVLQAMIGKLVLFASCDPRHDAADYVAECWLHLCRYPLARRPRRIAANLALDTRRAVWAAEQSLVPLDPQVLDQRPQPVRTDAIALIRAATRLGLIDRADGACLVAVYCLGLRSHEVGQQLSISADLVRWRNARSIRRLAPHAAALARVA